MTLRKITLLFCLCMIFGCSSKLAPVNIYISLEKKDDKTKYGNLNIVLKNSDNNKIISSLNTYSTWNNGY